jgi:hypothetical protein
MARARSRTPITAYAGVHTRDPQHLPWLALFPSGANAVHVWLPNTSDDGSRRPTATVGVARLTTSSQALRAGEMVTPSSPLTDLRCSRIYEDLRSTSALRRTRWLQVGCSVVATRRSSRELRVRVHSVHRRLADRTKSGCVSYERQRQTCAKVERCGCQYNW